MAHLDLHNIKIPTQWGSQSMREKLSKQGIEYNSRKRVLVCKGPREVDFGLRYQGASDQAGPNYTGLEAVDSYYTKVIIATPAEGSSPDSSAQPSPPENRPSPP